MEPNASTVSVHRVQCFVMDSCPAPLQHHLSQFKRLLL